MYIQSLISVLTHLNHIVRFKCLHVYMTVLLAGLVDFFTDNSSSSTTSNFDTVLSLIIHEKDRPDTVIGSILSTIGRGSTMKLESISYGSKVSQLR